MPIEITSRNNNNLTLKVIYPSDTFEELYDKIQYNFDQILINGGGEKGDIGIMGPRGYIGATGIGKKGDKGVRGSKLHYSSTKITDGSINSNPEYLLGDTVIDLYGDFFEIEASGQDLKYVKKFSLSSINIKQLWKEQSAYHAAGSNPIVSWILNPTASNAILADRDLGSATDRSFMTRSLVGIDTFVGGINTSSMIANILVDISDQPKDINEVSQTAYKFRPRHSQNTTTGTWHHRFIELNGSMVSALDLPLSKIYQESKVGTGITYIKSDKFTIFSSPDLKNRLEEESYDTEVSNDLVIETFAKLKRTKARSTDSNWDVEIKRTSFKDTIDTNRHTSTPEVVQLLQNQIDIDITDKKSEIFIIKPPVGKTSAKITTITGGKLNQIIKVVFDSENSHESVLLFDKNGSNISEYMTHKYGQLLTHMDSVEMIWNGSKWDVIDYKYNPKIPISINAIFALVGTYISLKFLEEVNTINFRPGIYKHTNDTGLYFYTNYSTNGIALPPLVSYIDYHQHTFPPFSDINGQSVSTGLYSNGAQRKMKIHNIPNLYVTYIEIEELNSSSDPSREFYGCNQKVYNIFGEVWYRNIRHWLSTSTPPADNFIYSIWSKNDNFDISPTRIDTITIAWNNLNLSIPSGGNLISGPFGLVMFLPISQPNAWFFDSGYQIPTEIDNIISCECFLDVHYWDVNGFRKLKNSKPLKYQLVKVGSNYQNYIVDPITGTTQTPINAQNLSSFDSLFVLDNIGPGFPYCTTSESLTLRINIKYK